MQYFIVMIDRGKCGFEAIIHPEDTRRQIIEQVREVLASDTQSLVHVKHIDGNYCEDVTDEFLHCAKWGDHEVTAADRQAWAFDHARDYRKETV